MMYKLKLLYRRQMFFPGWLGIFVNPFYFARAALYKAMLEFSPALSGKLLDIGCGSKPYQILFDVEAYIGLDIDSEHSRKRGFADQLYDGLTFPYPDDSFDSALCNQVLEHVFNPEKFLSEIARTLRPGGKLLLTVPFVWDEHEQPYDCARYTTFGLRALLESQGFRIIQHKKLAADASIIFQIANAYFYKITRNLPRPVRMVFTVSVMALLNVMGVVLAKVLPDNPDLYLDHIVLAENAF